MNKEKQIWLDKATKVLILISLLFTGLYFGRSILTPLFFSLFFAILLLPLAKKLEEYGLNRVIATLIVIVVLVLLVFAGIFFLSVQISKFANDIPELIKRFESMIGGTLIWIEGHLNISVQDQLFWLKENSTELIRSGQVFFGDAIIATSNILTFVTLVPIYTFLILLYREKFKKFMAGIWPNDEKMKAVRFMGRVEFVIQNYLTGLLIVTSIIAVLNCIGLLVLNIRYAIFFGILSALLTVIPYIGVFIGGCLPVLMALLTKDSLWYPIGVIAVYSFVQFMEGNFITPKIVGSKVDINPLAAIIGLLIAGKIWGIIGMILAIPLLAILKIIFKQSETLRPFAYLLENSKERTDSL